MMTAKTDIDAVATVAAAYFSANPVTKTEIMEIIGLIRDGLQGSAAAPPALPDSEGQKPVPVSIGKQQKSTSAKVAPAVAIEDSIQPDHLVCLICGKSQTTIRRHLRSVHAIEGDQYLKMFGLPADYPFAAPNYAASRSEIAKATTDVRLGRVQETGFQVTEDAPTEVTQSAEEVPIIDPHDDFGDEVINLDEFFKDTEPAGKKTSGRRKTGRGGQTKQSLGSSVDYYLENMAPEQGQELLDKLAEMQNQDV